VCFVHDSQQRIQTLMRNMAHVAEQEVTYCCRACSMREETLNTCVILIIKYEGRRPLGGPRHTREVVLKMDLKEIECERAD
jgi:hypothetical protein